MKLIVVSRMSKVLYLLVACGNMHAQGGYTALICAAIHGHADCVSLLIDAGANKEAKTNVRSRTVAWLLLRLICNILNRFHCISI